MDKKTSGIYKISNKITGDFYIGSSKNIEKRWANHKCMSEWTQCSGMRLYKDMSQYGLENFSFEVIEETTSLHEREQYWIEQLGPSYNDRRANGFDVERWKARCRKASKKYQHQLCNYNGETLTLNTLRNRFQRAGIPHASLEAKKYLLPRTD